MCQASFTMSHYHVCIAALRNFIKVSVDTQRMHTLTMLSGVYGHILCMLMQHTTLKSVCTEIM